MIYTRCYAPVKITSVTVAPEVSRRGDTFDQYWVTAELTGHYPDGSGKIGEAVHDGQQFIAAELRADDGWGEIMDEVRRVAFAQMDALNATAGEHFLETSA